MKPDERNMNAQSLVGHTELNASQARKYLKCVGEEYGVCRIGKEVCGS